MKPSHLVIAGIVFASVLLGCFALIDFSRKTATPETDSTPEAPSGAVNPLPKIDPVLPTPKLPSAALGGFGQVAKLERGYDGTAFLTDLPRGSMSTSDRGSATPNFSANEREMGVTDQ